MENIVIFGTGSIGRTLYRKLTQSGHSVICYVDNDSNKVCGGGDC
jgi:prephenate dehydrogenase